MVLSDTGHSRSLARGKGLLKEEQGAEAKFTVITRDPGGQQFCNEQEQVTVTGSVGQHEIEIKLNIWPLTGSPEKVEVKPHQYKVEKSFGSRELNKPYCIAKNEITGDIAVADYVNKRVLVLDKDMKHVKTIGRRSRLTT